MGRAGRQKPLWRKQVRGPSNGGKREGMAETARPNHPGGRKPIDKVRHSSASYQCQSSGSPEGCAHGAQKSELRGTLVLSVALANSSSSLMIEFWQRTGAGEDLSVWIGATAVRAGVTASGSVSVNAAGTRNQARSASCFCVNSFSALSPRESSKSVSDGPASVRSVGRHEGLHVRQGKRGRPVL